ncbi:molecular chaperone [Eremomyces bilateralis CBS 781.70]|uniref:Molecular chaperone n=1 Tax=Eremomyces bilateralis CBS 781.70 TaxID=1392243 RepID=A0A6G1G910_9PEZI|nr:molecular chaperone [Eremomyces bilateralis CBS 781.70]KAF1814503.1 molecular chaperone [Eremomyces bilateralis CBS 781.70]
MSGKATGSNATPNGDAKHRAHHDGSAGRAFTAEQKTAVIRVRKCAATGYYDILGLEEVRASCSDSDIKKAYRKLSLLTHPDKNGYDGADEAFKMVSRAFQVLSDPDKKTKYDKFGGDPDSRFGGGGGPATSPFSGFARSPGARGGGSMFEEEISPEEMFRQFFGGGGAFGGGGFGGDFFDGPVFSFNMGGGPGIRVHQFNNGRPRRRANGAQNEPAPSAYSTLTSLLPLLFLFVLPLLSSIFSGNSEPSGPQVRFDSVSPPYTMQHTSSNLKVPYYVNPRDVQDFGRRQWRDLDKHAETRYVGKLHSECNIETQQRERLVQDAQGWFFQDEEKMQRARQFDMKSCRRLHELTRR